MIRMPCRISDSSHEPDENWEEPIDVTNEPVNSPTVLALTICGYRLKCDGWHVFAVRYLDS